MLEAKEIGLVRVVVGARVTEPAHHVAHRAERPGAVLRDARDGDRKHGLGR